MRRDVFMAEVDEIKKRFIQLSKINGINKNMLREIEDILRIKLPEDFCQISDFYSGGLLGGISVFAFTHLGISPNIIDETLRLRNAISLPTNFIALAEPPESLIVLNSKGIPAVIWCDATDAVRIKDMSFISKPFTWKTYSDFFQNLIENEEEERAE